MKRGCLRTLSRQYAAGEIDAAAYRQSRRKLLDEREAEAAQPPPVPGGVSSPVAEERTLGKRFFLWLLGVACAVGLIVVAWRMPGMEERSTTSGAAAPMDDEPYRGRGAGSADGEPGADTSQKAGGAALPGLGPLCETLWRDPAGAGQFTLQFCFRAGEEDIAALLAKHANLGLHAVRYPGEEAVWLVYGRYDKSETVRQYAGIVGQALQRFFPGQEILQKQSPAR